MMQIDARVAALPALPVPYCDQKVVIQLYKAAALKCRNHHREWIMHPKETIARYVKALGSEEPDWSLMRYCYEIDGELQEIFRCRLILPLETRVSLHGDSLMANRADMTAALHALLYLLSKDLITLEGLPRLLRSPSLSSSESGSDSTFASTSSGSNVPQRFSDRGATSAQLAKTPATSTHDASIKDKATASRSRSVSCSISSVSNGKDGTTSAHIGQQTTLAPSGRQTPGVSDSHKNNQQRSSNRPSKTPTIQAKISPSSTGSTGPVKVSKLDSHASITDAHHPIHVAAVETKAAAVEAPKGAPPRHHVSLESARGFIDFYCKKYNFPRADIRYNSKSTTSTLIEATMFISESRVGAGLGSNMKEATSLCYIDACMWMSSCDDTLWFQFLALEAAHKSKDTAAAQLKNQQKAEYVPSVELAFSDKLDTQLRNVIWTSRKSELHRQALRSEAKAEEEIQRFKMQREQATVNVVSSALGADGVASRDQQAASQSDDEPMKMDSLLNKSRQLQDRQERYRADPRQAKMRETRASLPISGHASELMKAIEENPVLIVMAQTGSGKTTQLPQIILDHNIEKGNGAACNVICTQPRRLAAISVAQRVAAERDEALGRSVGYHVRFEHAFPERDGSILFMTSGIFLKRMQVGLEDLGKGKSSFLDEVSHIIVDEVHERDIDVDLLLFTLRRQLEERRKAGRPEFKVILMSATIDPSLFRGYFTNPRTGRPAPCLEIPGRTYPVTKFYLNEIYKVLKSHSSYQSFRWIFEEKEVKPYLHRELQNPLEQSAASRTDDDLKFPALLVALVVALVVQRTSSTRDGHVLVFLPGLEEIKAVQKGLLDTNRPLLNIDFTQYEVHILHSEVPIADQQLVFAPAARGVQRIILATNIAETSVTIPDVVYVVDAGKCKEKRFDPERHLSSLVQAFTGLGNMGQRAGRAGRHRPGEYFSLVSESRLACLPQNQTVEMKRLDLSNVVMHVKGLNLLMEVEDVLDDCIEPPGRQRVIAAIKTLQRVGALDPNKNLTSLGKVLLHLPVEAAIGKLCLLGCFFRCLDQVLAIAALLTNRDPFVAPIDKRFEANMAKKRFCPPGFTSDTLTSLKAYNKWASIRSFHDQRTFCDENFLSHGGLRTIEKLRTSLIHSLDRAGVLSLAAGGDRLQLQQNRDGLPVLPHYLNTNGENLPLLAALISCALAPGFAIRKGAALLRTPQDTSATLHASSIANIVRKKLPNTSGYAKEIFAYAEAVKNVSKGGAGQTNGMKMNSQLRGVTLLDPLGLLLFGVHDLAITRDGFLCDHWLPMAGKVDLLDDLQRFKDVLHACLLRAFEGLGAAMLERSKQSYSSGRCGEYTASDEYEDDPEDAGPVLPLSDQELDDLDRLAGNVVDVIQQHAIDNGLPASFDIARTHSREDDYIARQYSVRKAYAPDTVTVTKKEPVSRSEGGTWGDLVPTQISSGSTPTPTQVKQDNPPTVTRVQATDSRPEAGSRNQPAEVSNFAPDDGWGSWQARTDQNDAFERRASMRRGSSMSSSTVTVARSGNVPAMKEDAKPVSKVARIAASSHLSPPPKANGWIGTQNLGDLRSAQQDGWKDCEDALPAVPMSPKQDRSYSPVPVTPKRQPATLVHVPTSSGLPGPPDSNPSGHTTGWGPFEIYNPRTRSGQKDSGVSRDHSGSLSPSDQRNRAGLDKENAFPKLTPTTSGVPFRQNEPAKPQNGPAGWNDWTPSRQDDGEATYKSKMHTKPAVPITARISPTFERTMASVPVPAHPEPVFSRPASRSVVGTATASSSASNVSQAVSTTQEVNDPWGNWAPKVAPEKQGEETFARRVAMSRGGVALKTPSTVVSDSVQASPPNVPARQRSHDLPDKGQATAAVPDDDGWANYKPKVPAEKQGSEAFERRRAMAETGSGTRRNPSASYSSSSTLPDKTQAPAAVPGDDGWANYKPKVPAEKQGSEAFERRRAMAEAGSGTRRNPSASYSSSSISPDKIQVPATVPDDSAHPEPVFARLASRSVVGTATASTSASSVSQAVSTTQEVNDPWGNWAPRVAAEKQGEANFARRAAMSRGEVALSNPSTVVSDSVQASPPNMPAPQKLCNLPDSTQATAAVQHDDGWANYKPKVPAEKQGSEAFERRRAMTETGSGTRSNPSVIHSSSSTSSTCNTFRAPIVIQETRTMSIAGRANRDSVANTAEKARSAAYDKPKAAESTLVRNVRALKIAGSAAHATGRKTPQPQSYNAASAQQAKHSPSGTTFSRLQSKDKQSTTLPQLQGPTGHTIQQKSRGNSHVSHNRQTSQSCVSDASSSGSVLLVYERSDQVNGQQTRPPQRQTSANTHVNGLSPPTHLGSNDRD